MRIILLLISILSVALLSQCANYDFARRVVQQGNLLPKDLESRLKTGMSKDDVAILLGNSLISPIFNNNRWDYAYTYRKGNNRNEVKNLVLYFSGDRLVRVEHKP